jgi:hypothetical protein
MVSMIGEILTRQAGSGPNVTVRPWTPGLAREAMALAEPAAATAALVLDVPEAEVGLKTDESRRGIWSTCAVTR